MLGVPARRLSELAGGVQIGAVTYDRQAIADHASNLATTIQGNLKRSLEAIGVVRQPPHLTLTCTPPTTAVTALTSRPPKMITSASNKS